MGGTLHTYEPFIPIIYIISFIYIIFFVNYNPIQLKKENKFIILNFLRKMVPQQNRLMKILRLFLGGGRRGWVSDRVVL